MEYEEDVFQSDRDFCSQCGSILRIDHLSDTGSCSVCKTKICIEDLIGVKEEYDIMFTPLGYYSNKKKEEKRKGKQEEVTGQMDVDRECSKCNHKGMSYTTMQLRSADEGQTVFYLCPQCKHREVENS